LLAAANWAAVEVVVAVVALVDETAVVAMVKN
jgi:hypothetical protein